MDRVLFRISIVLTLLKFDYMYGCRKTIDESERIIRAFARTTVICVSETIGCQRDRRGIRRPDSAAADVRVRLTGRDTRLVTLAGRLTRTKKKKKI